MDRWEWENVMGANMGAAVGSAAVCGVLLPAGCGSGTVASAPTVAAAADAEWATVEELNAYYDYVAPLCADLPPATDPKGASVGRLAGRIGIG